jgi:fructosamine-3-kinase
MPGDAGDRERLARLERLLGTPVRQARAAGAQHGVRHFLVRLAGSGAAFVKEGRPGDEAAVAAEAAGLRWLAAAAAVGVPRVLGCDGVTLALELVSQQRPDRLAAERFGRELAALHATGSDQFGAPWPAFIAGLPLPSVAAGAAAPPPGRDGTAWPAWYAAARLLPFARLARDAGTFGAPDTAVIEAVAARIGQLAGPPEPASRIHGDCWSGNVLWSAGRGWLIDPAAQGGHRETDLAMLALFGAPHLDRLVAAYTERAPLADGWRARVALHQLHPLLVHVCLFGPAYREAAMAAARAALSA